MSPTTIEQLKEQVSRVMRERMDEPFVQSFLDWKLKPNEIFLYADYSLNGFELPANFDLFFYKDASAYIKVPVHTPFSIINGWAPTQTISPGHKYVCLLQFTDVIPSIINLLPEVTELQTAHRELVLTVNTYLPLASI